MTIPPLLTTAQMSSPTRAVTRLRKAGSMRRSPPRVFAFTCIWDVNTRRQGPAYANAVAIWVDNLKLDEAKEHTLRPSNEWGNPPDSRCELQEILTGCPQIYGPTVAALHHLLRVTTLQHDFRVVTPEYRKAVRFLRKRIGLETERINVPTHTPLDVCNLQHGHRALKSRHVILQFASSCLGPLTE